MTKDPKEFFEKFAKLCKEYKVEISVREDFSGYQTVADGIDFDFDGIYDGDGETKRPYQSFELGTQMAADTIVNNSKTCKVV